MALILLNIVFFLSFAVFAYLNFNDADAWLWVPIYGSATICCGLVVFGRFYPLTYLGLIAFYLVYALILFFKKDGVIDWVTKYKKANLVETMQATKPYIENTREFFGLLIISAALFIDYLASPVI